MGLTNKLIDIPHEVDIIIAGGGTAGCVVAGRLAEADPALSILVIEGGPDNFNLPSVVNPLLCFQHLSPASSTMLFYKSRPSVHLAGREAVVPSGGTLGGGSSTNFMMYTRAQRDDFDSWNMPGWTADEMLPYLQKLETYHGPGSPDRHGSSGPIHISNGGYNATGAGDEYMRVLAAAFGIPQSRDLQSLDANNCCERSLRYVSPDGRRQDAAHRYIHPKLRGGGGGDDYPNLHVLVETSIVRVLFDDDSNRTATGVEVTPNPRFQLETGVPQSAVHAIRARRLVVVSCGANGSPGVLERSGIGARAVLHRARVPVVVDLPGVGANLQDHHLVFLPFKTSLGERDTVDFLISGRTSADELIAARDSILGWNFVEVGVKMQPSAADRASFDPALLAAWERDFKDKPNKPMMLMGLLMGFLGDQSVVEPGQYVIAANYTGYPHSRGSVHITGPSPSDPLDYDAGFFGDAGEIDLKTQVWAYKKHREVMRRTSMYRGEVVVGHPKFPPGSKAAAVGDVQVPADSPSTGSGAAAPGELADLEYSADDDRAIEQFLRENVQTTWHSLGTCKMARRDEGGVVDGHLNVYGVRQLKVVDLSIPPENVGANTNNTALAIGEKGADIILKELGLIKT